MNSKPKWVVFTDLDGTLLDHSTYSYEAAEPALEQLRQNAIPVILNSSKTRPEMEALRYSLENEDPFIVENGAAVIVPKHTFETAEDAVITFAQPREVLLEVLWGLRHEGFRFKSFNDFTVAELARETGLTNVKAEMAKQRIATEPLLWLGSNDTLAEFKARLSEFELQLIKGGRFYHVMGQYDKADAMNHLMALYRQHTPDQPFVSVALGDSPNDQKMLAAADFAVIIKGVNSNQVKVPHSNVIKSTHPGPEGWNECITALLAQEKFNN